MGSAPQSVAITSNGQFGFIALADGNVAILDVPGRKIIKTIFVGGSPQFIITGLYGSESSTVSGTTPQHESTPQQVSNWGPIINVIASVLALALLIILNVFIVRRARAPSARKK